MASIPVTLDEDSAVEGHAAATNSHEYARRETCAECWAPPKLAPDTEATIGHPRYESHDADPRIVSLAMSSASANTRQGTGSGGLDSLQEPEILGLPRYR